MLYCHFIKIIKGHENMLEMFVIRLGFKKNKRKCNFHYAAMPMMTSQFLKFVDFTKTQKSR